jgi:hypothetical protein
MVNNFLQADIAERMYATFSIHYRLSNMHQSKTAVEMARLSQQDKEASNKQVFSAASQGV